jgi:hypothetical protein
MDSHQALWEAYFVPLINAVQAGSTGGVTGIKNVAGSAINPATEDTLKTIPIIYGEVYASPQDFSVAYLSGTTLTVTGAPFDIDDTINYVGSIIVKNAAGIVTKYVNGVAGVSINAASNVITISGTTLPLPFINTDTVYRVTVLGQEKAYDPSTDTEKVTEQSPLSEKYVQDSIVDATNTAAATTYFPSSTGMSMDGFKDMSITGIFTSTGILTFTVEVTNDEDTTNANWIQIYAFDTKNNAAVNSLAINNATATFAWDFDDFNYSNFRLKVVDASSTNTYIVKMRRKAL